MGDVAKQAVECGFRLLKLAVLLEIDAWQRPRQGTWRQKEPPAHGIDARASASQVDVYLPVRSPYRNPTCSCVAQVNGGSGLVPTALALSVNRLLLILLLHFAVCVLLFAGKLDFLSL